MNIVIAGFPRSGNTYLGYLLSYYFNAGYIDLHVWPRVLNKEIGLDEMLLDPTLFGGNLSGKRASSITHILKTHSLFSEYHSAHKKELDMVDYQKAADFHIVIYRDPKDVAVSYFYYKRFRQQRKNKTGIRKIIPNFIFERILISKYLENDSINTLNEWLTFMRSWVVKTPKIYFISYEELRLNPNSIVENLCKSLNCQYSKDLADEALDICSFENMQLLEKRKDGNINSQELKTRKGEVGQYSKYFSRRLLEKFREADDLKKSLSDL